MDVVCLVVRAWLAWLSDRAGGLGANAVTEDRAVGVLELECVWVRSGMILVAEGRVGRPLICPWCMPIKVGRPER